VAVMAERALGLLSATELLSKLRDREVSSRELLAHFTQRRATYNDQLNAIVTVDDEAAERAALAADEQLVAGAEIPPLLGLPMTIKDAIATKGMRSTGGAIELADHVPDTDAQVVAHVRSAGAVVFGKTNLPRWSADVQAYNEIFGTTNNPWDLSCGPGGSSGGAAAAIAAGLTGAEIGSDIGGSVRLPAHFAGVCGHKPSFGIVPQLGYISHTTYQTGEPDVNALGPIARSVDDCELLLDVIAGPRQDLASAWKLTLPPARHERPSDFRVGAHLDDPSVPISAEVAAALDMAVQALEASGINVDRTAWPQDLAFGDVRDVGLPLISAATSPARGGQAFEAMQQIVLDPTGHTETQQMRSQATAMFHRDWLLLSEQRELNRHKWTRFFGDFDVLLAPVAHVAAFPHQQEGTLYDRKLLVDGAERPYAELIMWTSQFGYVGLPSTVVPVAISPRGVPVGIQVVGPHLGDRTTLAFARHLEELLGGYQVPPNFT
jgi:amidase